MFVNKADNFKFKKIVRIEQGCQEIQTTFMTFPDDSNSGSNHLILQTARMTYN